MSSTESPLSFPVLLLDEPHPAWRWPAVPFAWAHVVPPDEDGGQPCRLETLNGASVQGFLTGVDPRHATISFRTAPGAMPVELPFSRFRRLVLTVPLRSVEQPRIRAERVPVAAQLRELRVHGPDGVTRARSCGYVHDEVGLFLFTPGPDPFTLVREFVPRGACHRIEVGATTLDKASRQWIHTREALLEAADHQRRMSIKPIGQSLLALGMITEQQLEQALAQPSPDKPLGERLVHAGVISRADLHTAIAHKMGYPFVDLARFPIDLAVARELPLRTAVTHRALPIMLDQHRMFIAVDRPSRTTHLGTLFALARYNVVPVLASKSQILLRLSALSHDDVWHEHVAVKAGFFDTVI